MTKFIELSADGTLDLDDIGKLEACLNDEQNNLDMIRTMLNFKKDILENRNGFSDLKAPQTINRG